MSHREIQVAKILSIPFEENAYIARLEGRDDCLVVDPGLEPEKVVQYLESEDLVPSAILNTHGHSDHIGGNAALKQRWPDCPLVIGSADAAKLTDPRLNLSATFGGSVVSPPADVTVDDGDRYCWAGIELQIRAISGHSTGHVVYLCQQHRPPMAFVGDVIFAGSIGRTDFPDGSFPQLQSGIHTKLFTLADETVLLPGHGPATTVGQEKGSNPFVGLPSGEL